MQCSVILRLLVTQTFAPCYELVVHKRTFFLVFNFICLGTGGAWVKEIGEFLLFMFFICYFLHKTN